MRIAAPAPGAFAAVMATGIVSIAALEHGHRTLAEVLSGLAVAGLVIVGGLVLVRLVLRMQPVAGELRDPGVALPLFSAVAACAVLGARFASDRPVAVALGAVGLVGWLVLLPVAARALRRCGRAGLRASARGAWLLPAVATAGLAITSADLASGRTWLVVTGVAGWVVSLGLYLGAIGLIAARAVADDVVGDLLAGDSWIVMGGLAICTLAADRLIRAAGPAHASAALDPWLRPGALACWGTASVLVPVLAVAHARQMPRRIGRPRHNVFWWAAVFPLGMYSVATRATASRFGLAVLPTISRAFFWIALVAWVLAAAGLLHAGIRRARSSRVHVRA